jgi:MarR family transcriptional regulator, transcriptional regulator for hemolysin
MQDLSLRVLQTETFLEFARLAAIQHQRLRELFERAELGEITPQQSRSLMVLFQAREPLTARELSRRMGCSEVTISRFVRALSKAGWVERRQDPKDKRAYLLTATAKAREAFPRFIHVSNELLDEIFSGFEREEIEQLARVVGRIRSNLGEG